MNIVLASISLAIILLIWGALIAWQWYSVYRFSRKVFIARRKTGEILAHVEEGKFVKAYVQSEGPRATTYLFACAVLATIFVPAGMTAFSFSWQFFWQLTSEPEVFRRGTMIHVFAMVLAGMAVMILVVVLGMRRYHSNVPVKINKLIDTLNKSGSR